MDKFYSRPKKKERTLVLIKPDGVKRALIGEIIHSYRNARSQSSRDGNGLGQAGAN